MKLCTHFYFVLPIFLKIRFRFALPLDLCWFLCFSVKFDSKERSLQKTTTELDVKNKAGAILQYIFLIMFLDSAQLFMSRCKYITSYVLFSIIMFFVVFFFCIFIEAKQNPHRFMYKHIYMQMEGPAQTHPHGVVVP